MWRGHGAVQAADLPLAVVQDGVGRRVFLGGGLVRLDGGVVRAVDGQPDDLLFRLARAPLVGLRLRGARQTVLVLLVQVLERALLVVAARERAVEVHPFHHHDLPRKRRQAHLVAVLVRQGERLGPRFVRVGGGRLVGPEPAREGGRRQDDAGSQNDGQGLAHGWPPLPRNVMTVRHYTEPLRGRRVSVPSRQPPCEGQKGSHDTILNAGRGAKQ